MSSRDQDGLLEIRTVRRQQLTTAALHGSSRSWMARRRKFSAVVGGLALAAAIVLGVGITQVIRAQIAANNAKPPANSTNK